ncbi:MAG: phosphotransferase [Nakamurella sp.]
MDAATVIALPALDDLGTARIPAARLNLLVSTALGRPVQVGTLTVTPVDYPSGSIATGALLRCAGTAVACDGECLHWRLFVKVLQSARVWPLLDIIPELARQQWVDEFPWRIEIDSYRSRVSELLGDGIRLPEIYDVIEIDDDHAAIWMEDVVPSSHRWDDATFGRAARHLGVLAGRRPLGTDVTFGRQDMVATPGYALRMFCMGRVLMGAAPMLRNPELWRHPSLAAALVDTGEGDLATDLVAALDRITPWLAAMNELPQTYVHGDASPQNLLRPADDPDSFVLIDFSFNTPHCVGFDLGQLLVGLVHAGEMEVDAMDRIRRVIVPAYVDGLRSTGFAVTPGEVEQGFLLASVVRSLFTAVPLETLDRPDAADLRSLLAARIRLARYLLTCADEITAGR